MPRLYSPSLPATPLLGRALTIPVPFVARSHNRTTTLNARLIILVLAGVAVFGFILHPSSPAQSVIPSKLKFHDDADPDLITESHSGGWSWFEQDRGKETILVTGGAGQLGQALLPSLLDHYNVHVLDIAARPDSLPRTTSLTYHRGSIDPSSAALFKLFAKTKFDGVVHLAGVSLEEWCAPKAADCERINVGGTRSLVQKLVSSRRTGRTAPSPWMIFASSVDARSARPTTALGRTKLAAEKLLQREAEGGELRVGVIRLDDVYGYSHSSSIESTFLPSLITNAITGLPIQYSSDRAARDYTHIDDIVEGFRLSIEHVKKSPGTSRIDLVSGERKTEQQLVEYVRRQTSTLSPIRDLGRGQPQTRKDLASINDLGWRPTIDIESGLATMINALISDTEKHSLQYLAENCLHSEVLALAPSMSDKPRRPHPADERNKDMTKLDGCTVNIGFDHDGFLHHLKCEDGKHCIADGVRVNGYNWNQTVFVVRREAGGKGERRVRVRFEEEKGTGWLGYRSHGREVGLELVGSSDIDVKTVFDLEVDSTSSSLRLLVPGTEQQIHSVSNVTDETNWFTLEGQTRSHFDARMTVLCCPSAGDWPLLLDDHETADVRFGSTGQIPFNSSRRAHLCQRAEDSVRYSSARLAKYRAGQTEDREVLPAVSWRPHSWALKDLPSCWNDCDSPTVCVQTGSCRCVQADHCPPRRENPLLLLDRKASTSTGAMGSNLGSLAGYSPVLVEAVARVDWRDILLPHAREALLANPEFIKVHVADGYEGQEAIESAECHKLQDKHCFSADSVLYRAMRHLSVSADEAELVVLPVYQHCTGAPFNLHDVVHYASETIPGIKEKTKPMSVVMTHDWGICIVFAWEIWGARNNYGLHPDWILDDMLAFSVMGDFDSPCYRPAQDVVIPARSCRSIELKDAFATVEQVRPVSERPHLITWSGTYWGTGKSDRLRLTCDRGGAATKELVPGGGPQSSFMHREYMNELTNARFCPQPRGIAGWSPRVSDAIYAGCIPVLTAEGSHYPFASFLDWSKFSVRVHPTELDQIESILAAIPLERVEEMQANLVAVREAFVYATDEKPDEELERRGPMFFALHEAGLRLRTKYPAKQA